jgi:nitrogen fixation NifU-like protein
MTSELRELYQDLILDHSKNPRTVRAIESANRKAEGFNPLCGDRITLYLQVKKNVIHDIGFQGSGCAISKSSASMMTASLKGKTEAEARKLFEQFHAMVSGKGGCDQAALGKLFVFQGVTEFPIRVKCATLAWHTLKAGLEQSEQTISTEE